MRFTILPVTLVMAYAFAVPIYRAELHPRGQKGEIFEKVEGAALKAISLGAKLYPLTKQELQKHRHHAPRPRDALTAPIDRAELHARGRGEVFVKVEGAALKAVSLGAKLYPLTKLEIQKYRNHTAREDRLASPIDRAELHPRGKKGEAFKKVEGASLKAISLGATLYPLTKHEIQKHHNHTAREDLVPRGKLAVLKLLPKLKKAKSSAAKPKKASLPKPKKQRTPGKGKLTKQKPAAKKEGKWGKIGNITDKVANQFLDLSSTAADVWRATTQRRELVEEVIRRAEELSARERESLAARTDFSWNDIKEAVEDKVDNINWKKVGHEVAGGAVIVAPFILRDDELDEWE
ncbi:uncharacterized protein C8Q71DRAFT_269973 [Rhodofomes roseus]|uniref:Uncharacterized protein n=1 Tax=Rhodofomes roseus TaxID=34475 RepID=A0ABQ8K5P9_9APHY|nr:uncharacterized protein C8Q71DRAFT_269973 [Rhodofomes roseus]KAH9832288.1 hypothetical protein C8Q71DRAFT_269973 [Rhodofomes roseus]